MLLCGNEDFGVDNLDSMMHRLCFHIITLRGKNSRCGAESHTFTYPILWFHHFLCCEDDVITDKEFI
jgi:hypothetical protein